MDYEKKTVLVTGGSRGIGIHIARRFWQAGADVVITSRDEKSLFAAADSIGGERIFPRTCDVRNPEALADLFAFIEARTTRLDVLVNNAGGSFRAPLTELSANGWHAIIDSNLSSVFHCSTAALSLLQSSRGNIVNIGSVAAAAAHPMGAAYGAAKAGVEALTKTMAHEWAEHGIRVNCLRLGPFATEKSPFVDGEIASKITAAIPLGRLGNPEEAAEVCCFVASPAASYMTGSIISVDGGPRRALEA